MPTISGEFAVTSWNEDPYFGPQEDGAKMTHATVAQAFRGPLSGKGSVDWLMYYRDDGTADFVGLQRVDGSLGGHAGSLILESRGDFDGKEAVGTWSIIPGSGTGELAGVQGDGRFHVPLGGEAQFDLDYSID